MLVSCTKEELRTKLKFHEKMKVSQKKLQPELQPFVNLFFYSKTLVGRV